MSRSVRAVAVAGVLAVSVGCDGGKPHYPVEGVVQFDDGTPAKVLAGGTVSLEAVEDRSNAAGEIGPDGAFQIRDPLGKPGTPAGVYRVAVFPPPGGDRRKPPIDPAHSRYETSGIQITVKEESNRVTVTVRKPGEKKN